MSKEDFGKYTNAQLAELIRNAMSEGCIKPCHVYDAVDILLDRLADKPPRNCDIGTAEEQEIRFSAFCLAHRMQSEKGCTICPCHTPNECSCEFVWSQMPYGEKESEMKGS